MTECVEIKRILNMPRVMNMLKFWIRQISKYDRVFNMSALHSLLNMPEYTVQKF